MSNTTTVSDVLGRRVVSSADANELGTVDAFVLDRPASRIERVQVGGSRRKPELVEWRHIDSIGSDAVMVGASDDVHGSEVDEDELYVRGDIDVVGAQVLDTGGRLRGTVTDLHFDADDGSVVAALTDEGRIPADRIRALGTFALVVDAD